MNNIKVAKELVRIAKILVGSSNSIFIVKRLPYRGDIYDWQPRTPISKAPYDIIEMSKADLSKYIKITSDGVTFQLPSYFLTLQQYVKYQSDQHDFNPFRMFYTTDRKMAEAGIQLACSIEAKFNNKNKNKNKYE